MINVFQIVEISWGARAEPPVRLAERFLLTINRLRKLDKYFQNWHWLKLIRAWGEEENGETIQLIEDYLGLSQEVENNVNCGFDRTYKPDPDTGYLLLASTVEEYQPNYVRIYAGAGNSLSSYISAFANDADVGFAANGAPPSIVNFDTVKSLLLIMAETWEASSGIAFSTGEFDMALAGKGFKWGWMTYLSPYFAERIEPPSGIILEYRPTAGCSWRPRRTSSTRPIRSIMMRPKRSGRPWSR